MADYSHGAYLAKLEAYAEDVLRLDKEMQERAVTLFDRNPATGNSYAEDMTDHAIALARLIKEE